MAKYLSPEKMGLEGEGLQCWNKLEDKLAVKLSQLTRLLHHFSAYPPEPSLENPEELASQHESEIHDILNETASRIRQFKSSLQIQAQDNRIQEAIEAMKTEHEAIQHATQRDLKKAESIAKELEETMQESHRVSQDTMKKQEESFSRERLLLRSELQAKVDDLEKARLASQQYRREIEDLQTSHQFEVEHEKEQNEKVRQDLLVLAQSQLQSRETELQAHLKNQFASHCEAMQEMKARHTTEMEQLKLHSVAQLEKFSHDCASQEAEWHNEKLELQKQVAVAAQEKMECGLAAQCEIQEGVELLRTVEEDLTKEKEKTSKLQNDLNVAEEDIQFLKENIKTASINNDNLAIALGTMKQEAIDSRNTYNSAISKWETVAVQLRQDLENMTNVCATNETDIKGYKIKVDELAFQLITTRKELGLAKIDQEQFQIETRRLNLEVETKKEDIRRIESDAEARNRKLLAEISCLQLESIAQNESSTQKMKEIMEVRIQQQLQVHERDKKTLQKTFIAQLEEDRKEKKFQLEALELRQREEKAQAKSACAEFSRTLKAMQQKLDEQETKSLSKMLPYETKVIALMERLDSLESSSSGLEEEFGSLSKQLLKHSKQSKHVGSTQHKILKETEEKCSSLETAMVKLTKEHAASTEQQEEMVKHLKLVIADQERAHSDVISTTSEAYKTQIQQCMDDMQRTKDEHRLATQKLLQAHEMEVAELRSSIESQKNAEAVEERTRLQKRLQKNTLELNEEMDLMRLEFDKALREQKESLEEMTKNHDRVLRSHLAVIRDQKEAAEAELKRCEQAHARALTSCTEKFTRELDKLEDDRAKQLEKLEQSHSEEFQDVITTYRQRLSASEENWKQQLALVEKQWKSRLENEEILWRIERDSEIEELRKSLLFSAAEEKILMAADHKIKATKLENRISELETSVTEKDEKVWRLQQDIVRMDESHKMLELDLQTKHKTELCDIFEKQRIELSEVQREGAALVEELQEKQKMELESSYKEMEKVKVQMMEKQIDLEKKLEKLQERFVNRESRVEDVARISKLESTCEQKDVTITKLNGRTNQLQLELYNREENYNKIFGNSAPLILQQGMSDWLRPKNKNDKRSISSSRHSPKAAESNGRSASTLL